MIRQFTLGKAIALDPDFARPLIQVGGQWTPRMVAEVHRGTVGFFQPVHGMQLTTDQQRLVGMIDARMEGRWEDAFLIAVEEHGRHPEDSMHRWQVVRSAGWANRPRTAIEAYNGLEYDPLAPSTLKTIAVQHVCDAFHRFGRYDEELALIRDMVAAGPISFFGLPPQWLELRALIGLGRTDEVDRVLSEILLMPLSGAADWGIMGFLADELRVHGFPDAAQAMADRSVAWWDGHPEVPRRLDYSRCLMSAGRVEEAWTIQDNLMQKYPDEQYVLKQAGVCAARLGDRNRALEIETRLAELGEEALESDGIFGYHGVTQYRSAQIRARLGEHDRAISLLQQAVTAGFYNYLLIHRDANFEALWDDPEFQEILRPKG